MSDILDALKVLVPTALSFVALLLGARAKRLNKKADTAIAALEALKEHHAKEKEREEKEKAELDALEKVQTDEEAIDFFNKFVGEKK
jgi:hypothetical protein